MTKKYENIHFEAFLKEPVRALTASEKQSYISKFYESIGQKQKASFVRKNPCRISHRRMILVAASLTMILAFGAVAGAAGWLQLGEVDGDEISAIRDSTQHKAGKTVAQYESSLSKEELIALDEERWGKGAFEDIGTYDTKTHSITYAAPTEKTQEILDKYHLEYERTHYYVNSAKEAFDQAGIGNILGDFKDINDLKLTGKNVYSGEYIYTDKGSALLFGGGDSPKEPYWELQVRPQNVYVGKDTFVSSADKSNPEYTEWDFITKEGYSAKAVSYLETLGDDTGKETYRNFQALLFTKNYKIIFGYTVELPSHDLSNQEFEKLIGKFDFSKLP